MIFCCYGNHHNGYGAKNAKLSSLSIYFFNFDTYK